MCIPFSVAEPFQWARRHKSSICTLCDLNGAEPLLASKETRRWNSPFLAKTAAVKKINQTPQILIYYWTNTTDLFLISNEQVENMQTLLCIVLWIVQWPCFFLSTWGHLDWNLGGSREQRERGSNALRPRRFTQRATEEMEHDKELRRKWGGVCASKNTE